METNFQKYINIINQIKDDDSKPSLMLHICCAPCSSGCLENLVNYFDVKALFYNPNISPYEEYDKRKQELKRFICENEHLKNVQIIDCDYDNKEYLKVIKGLENEKEGGLRCNECFKCRFKKTAFMAKKYGCDYFATTLTISPMKDEKLLNSIGENFANVYGVKYLYSNFKKQDGYKKSIENSKKYHLYRQDYCGCIYSKLEREKQKNEK